jgi:two-component system response regulator YesN
MFKKKKEHIFRIVEIFEETYPLSTLDNLPANVRIAFRYMEKNFKKGIGLNEAARYVRMHPSSLCKAIKESMNKQNIEMTCSLYLNWLRVKKGMEYMCSNPLIKDQELAAKVGTGVKNMRKIFMKCTGMSPSEFKNHVM